MCTLRSCNRGTQLPQLRAAVTLTELLIVVAVIVALSALSSTVYVAAKRSAARTIEISNLRSLGQAAQLYAEQFGAYPTSATTLVSNRQIPKAIVLSPLDPSSVGFMNLLVTFHSKASSELSKLVPTYPCSYLGLGDYGYDISYIEKNIRDQPGAGWLVSLVETEPWLRNQYGILLGKYRRLLLDGSVQSRQHSWHYRNGTRVDHPAFWFADGGAEWRDRIAEP